MLLFDSLEAQGLRLILASQSPRRRELIEGSRLPAEIISYEVDESYPATLPAVEVPEYLARLKSQSYPAQLSDKEILITADTVVICDNQILGKPTSKEHATAMLNQISGGTHTVVTGVALRSKAKERSFSCSSIVRFAPLTAEEIDFYIEHYRPFDKAGSYGIQEWIGYIGIESIEGSFYNVMGLPIQRLYTELKNFI